MQITINTNQQKEKSILEKVTESAGRMKEEEEDSRQDVLDNLSNIMIDSKDQPKTKN
mgnify:CR=1 FL=1